MADFPFNAPIKPAQSFPTVLGRIIDNGGQVFNVKAFGAKGDGVTDDTKAIQAAYANGGLVYFPAGQYVVTEPLEPPSFTTLFGAGIGITTITIPPSAFANFSYAYLIQGAGIGVKVMDMTLDGQKRNGTNPANEAGLLNVGTGMVAERVSFYDPNYFGVFLNPSSINSKLIDCESDLGGNNDSIGGGGGLNCKIIRHTWREHLAGNLFDNVGGTNVVLDGCIDNAHSNAGGFYFEGMTQSGIRNSYIQRQTTLQDDSGYSPTIITEPNECFIDNNVFATSALEAGAINIELRYQADSGTITPGGGNRIIGNRFIYSSGTPIVLAATLLSSCYGGDIVSGNVIINPNNGGTAGGLPAGNNGISTYAQSGIVVAGIPRAIITKNTCIDNRSTHLMGYAISSGHNVVTTDCIISDNTCLGSSPNSFLGVADIGMDSATGCLIVNNTTGVGIADYYRTNIARGNIGYNPVGNVDIAVPETGVPTSALNYDSTYYVTAGATSCSILVDGSTIVVPASTCVPIQVPAGSTVTPTYTDAPTWVVAGN